DIGLSVHRYSHRLDAFTQALDGGKALSVVRVDVYFDSGMVVAQGMSDSDGHAHLPLPSKAAVVLSHKDEQTSMLRLNSSALD
ncbi:hypothetical protein RA275_28765, partial [Pseudomonas syringae pv. tagetis]